MIPTAFALILLVSAVALTAVILRFRPVRSSRVLVLAFLLNPGLVGVLAACALLARTASPGLASVLRAASLVGLALSLPLLALALPRALRRPSSANRNDGSGTAP